jgi:hypothetical protein
MEYLYYVGDERFGALGGPPPIPNTCRGRAAHRRASRKHRR